MGSGYFLAFILQNGRFVFTTCLDQSSEREHTKDQEGHHIPPPPGCHRQSGHFIPVFQLLFRIFSLWMPTSETRCPAHPAHLRLKYTAILPQPRGGRPIGVLTRQEGRLQVKRTGPSLVLRVSGSCCCLGLKLRLEPLVHFQTGSSLRQAPPTSNAPVGHSY